MKVDSNSTPPFYYKHNPFFIKIILFILFLGLTIRFLSSSNSFDFSSFAVQTQQQSHDKILAPHNGTKTSNTTKEVLEEERREKCDIFKGEWVPNPRGSVYNNRSCEFIEDHQNCMRNGRPDSDYLNWRWSPFECKLGKFNPQIFLNIMRNKRWAFIGDSISRNHVQSLICILSQVEKAKEIYHDEQFKSKTWIFPSYNLTISVIWTPFLVKADIYEDNNGFSTSEIQLHLDKIDEKWTSQYKDFDYTVISAGKWFLKTAIYYENNTIQGCHYCHAKNLTELGFDYAYRKVLNSVFNFVTNSSYSGLVIYRTVTPDHFENGEWSSGGTCKRTVPFKEGQKNMSDVDSIMYEIELQEFDKVVRVGSASRPGLKLLNTTHLSLLRPDGHPGPYRQMHPFDKDKNAKVQNDCLHWCLPGPIDAWNDLVMDMLMNP